MIKVEGLCLSVNKKKSTFRLVRDVNYSLEQGETLAIVGESGSGKSLITYALLGMLNHLEGLEGTVEAFGQKNILKASSKEIRRLRRNKIGYIPQNPRESLTPTLRIGSQLAEVVAAKTGKSRRSCRLISRNLLQPLGFSEPEKVLQMYPHQLSGGMCQRVAVAMAIASSPAAVVADEPTSSLDLLTKYEIIKVIKSAQEEQRFTLVLVTHDLDLAFKYCNKIAVVYGGRLFEMGTANELYVRPRHPYTRGLVRCFTGAGMANSGLHYIPGEPVSIYTQFTGCRYFNRCQMRLEICEVKEPPCVRTDGRRVACWLYGRDEGK
jgi:oligopeptide/dipeptide ABC transporter ATP-binding protein